MVLPNRFITTYNSHNINLETSALRSAFLLGQKEIKLVIFATSVVQLLDRELLVLRELRPDVYQSLTIGTVKLENEEKIKLLSFMERR